jgi:steroid 5-alpha reductase family enzyme
MIFNTFVFVLAYFVYDDLSIIDITWGPMHLIPLFATAYQHSETWYEGTLVSGVIREPWTKKTVEGFAQLPNVSRLILALVSLWAVRLSFHIFMRHEGEDYRYKMIKSRWAHRSWFGRMVCSYVYIFFMQGLFSMWGNGAAIFVLQTAKKYQQPNFNFDTYRNVENTLGPWELLGTFIWLVGFFFEVVGDM